MTTADLHQMGIYPGQFTAITRDEARSRDLLKDCVLIHEGTCYHVRTRVCWLQSEPKPTQPTPTQQDHLPHLVEAVQALSRAAVALERFRDSLPENDPRVILLTDRIARYADIGGEIDDEVFGADFE